MDSVHLGPPLDFIPGSPLKLLWISLFTQGYLITGMQIENMTIL